MSRPKRASAKRGRAAATSRRRIPPSSKAEAAVLQESASTAWEQVADWYDHLIGSQGGEYHQAVILPGVERMLRYSQTDIHNMRVLDLACGQGVLCRYLAERGVETTGIDLSEAMLERARLYTTAGPQPRYLLADATDLLDAKASLRYDLQEGSFAAVTLVLAVQNMTPLSPLWRGVNALLRPGGALIVVMMHPCFRVPQHSDWKWNDTEHRQERKLWRYLSSAEIQISAHPGQRAEGKRVAETVHFHRPLQAYLNTLGNAGLWVDHIEEWCSHKSEEPGIKQEALDAARREFPLFLALRARKAGR